MNSLIQYLNHSREELAKVTWPTNQETLNSTVLVIVVSLLLAAFLGAVDYGFSRLLEYLLRTF